MARRLAVIGAGTMGTGIAYVFAVSGWKTTVVEPNEERARESRHEIAQAALGGVKRGVLPVEKAHTLADEIHWIAAIDDIAEQFDLIIESVPEQPALKQRVLLAAEARQPRLLATNTSSLSIDELASSLEHPDRFIGLHFFNPVWSFSLVEVVKGAKTSAYTLTEALQIVEDIGKKAAVVADFPGFATSRLDLIASLEAMRMVEDGVGTPADIDRAMQLGYRHPVGPLWLSDLVGLDVRLDIARRLFQALGPRFEPPQLLIDMVNQGHLGKKSGRGFYEWTTEEVDSQI